MPVSFIFHERHYYRKKKIRKLGYQSIPSREIEDQSFF